METNRKLQPLTPVWPFWKDFHCSGWIEVGHQEEREIIDIKEESHGSRRKPTSKERS